MRRGITTVADIRARCDVDPVTMCWHWKGATSRGQPRIHAFDHAAGCKRVQPGQRAVWNIAFDEAPPAWALVFRRCCSSLCLNPVHLGLSRSKAEIGEHIRRNGARKGTAVEARRANAAIGRAAAGIVDTPVANVIAIRSAPSSTTGRALAQALGMSEACVSRIRRGETHRGVGA